MGTVLATLLGCVVFLAVMAGLFVPLEYFFPKHTKRRSNASIALAAVLFVANTFLMQWLGVPVLQTIRSFASPALEQPSLITVALVFIASDLFGYWTHRLMHRVPFFWRFHRLHHEATDTTWIDAWRQHPVDFVLHGIAVGVPGALLGASLSDIASVVVLRKAFTTFLHANLSVGFGPLRWVVASPEFHHHHHSADPRDFDTNFAGTFPVWDVVFGTTHGHHGRRSRREDVAAHDAADAPRGLVGVCDRAEGQGDAAGAHAARDVRGARGHFAPAQ